MEKQSTRYISRWLLTVLLVVLLFSCNNEKFTVGSVTGTIVDSMDAGCFFYDADDEKVQLFASGPDSVAYILLNGKLAEFKYYGAPEQGVSDSGFIELYRYNDYELKVEMMEEGVNDGGNFYKGFMRVTNKQGEFIEKRLEGRCGC